MQLRRQDLDLLPGEELWLVQLPGKISSRRRCLRRSKCTRSRLLRSNQLIPPPPPPSPLSIVGKFRRTFPKLSGRILSKLVHKCWDCRTVAHYMKCRIYEVAKKGTRMKNFIYDWEYSINLKKYLLSVPGKRETISARLPSRICRLFTPYSLKIRF